MSTDPSDGVIKFVAAHVPAPLPSSARDVVHAMTGWRSIVFRLGLLGQDPSRYDGAAYGNVSARIGPFPGKRGTRTFAISGTQTGGKEVVGEDDFAVVTSWDVKRNRVASHGPALPSSESMTHGAVYDASPAIRAVIHVHAPVIFHAARALALPLTAPGIDYGTPAMASEVSRLWRTSTLPERRVFVMSAHLDGVVAFGADVDGAGTALLTVLARASTS